jgi:hypothetical protein
MLNTERYFSILLACHAVALCVGWVLMLVIVIEKSVRQEIAH